MPVTPIPELARRSKAASRLLATASSAVKDEALRTAADLLEARRADILAANARDVAGPRTPGSRPGWSIGSA